MKPIFKIKHIKCNDWSWLSENPNTIRILEPNLNEIDSLDYEKMKKNNRRFFEELVQRVFYPERLKRLSALYEFNLMIYMENDI